MLYLNHPLLTTPSIIQYFETEVLHQVHDALSQTPSPLKQLQNKLKAIFFEHLGRYVTHQTVLASLAVDDRFVSNYPHLKEVLALVFSFTDASDKEKAYLQLNACKGIDWNMEEALSCFIALNTAHGYFDQHSQMHFELFKKLAIANRAMIVLFEKNNSQSDTMAYQYAYKLMALFVDSSNIHDVEHAFKMISHATHKLLDTSGSRRGKPFHDVLLVATHLPKAEEVHDLAGWRTLIKKEGEKALPFFSMAKQIETKLAERLHEARLRAPKTLQEAHFIDKLCGYSRGAEDPNFAALCAQYHIDEGIFNAGLDYMASGWPKKTRDSIPSVISAADGFYWLKLPSFDKRALILGKITYCCQSIGGDADACVRDATRLSDNGLYVLLKQKTETGAPHPMVGDLINDADFDIVGQSYVWISLAGNLCLDSIEFGLETVTPATLKKILTDFANQVLQGSFGIKRVMVGCGGKTPEDLFSLSIIPEKMRQGFFYGDADTQYCIARLPHPMSPSQSSALSALLKGKSDDFCACIQYLCDYVTDTDDFIRHLSALFIKAPSLLTQLTPVSIMRLFMFSPVFSMHDLEPVNFDELYHMSPDKRATALRSISTTRLVWRENDNEDLLKVLPYVNSCERLHLMERNGLVHDIADHHHELLATLLNLLSFSEQLQAAKLKDKHGRLLLHCVVNNQPLLMDVLNLYPVSERLEAVKTTNHNGRTVLQCAINNTESLNTLLNALSLADCLEAVRLKFNNGRTVLSYAVKTPVLLERLLNLFPEPDRLELVKTTGYYGHALLQDAKENIASLTVILNALSSADRLEAIKIKDTNGGTVLNYVKDNPELLATLLNLYPPSDRLEAVITSIHYGRTLLRSAVSNLPSLLSILNALSIPERQEVVYMKEEDGCTLLHFALSCDSAFNILFNLIPPRDRFFAVMLKNKRGRTLLHDAGRDPESLTAILSLYPKLERLVALQVKDNHGYSCFESIVREPESMIAVLRLLPVSDRPQAMNEKASGGLTALNFAARKPLLLRMMLNLLSPFDRFEAVTTTDDDIISDSPSFIVILRSLPAKVRFYAVSVKDYKGLTALHYAAGKNASLLVDMINLLPKSRRLEAVKIADNDGRTLLRFAAGIPASLRYIINCYPVTERLSAVKRMIKEGRALLHYVAEYPDSLSVILNLYPKLERLNAVKALDENGYSVLCFAAQSAKSLTLVLNLYPKSERLDVVKMKYKGGGTLLHIAAAGNHEALTALLNLYPLSERMEAILAQDERKQTVLHYAECKIDSLSALLQSLPESNRYDLVQKNIGILSSAYLFQSLKEILIAGLAQEERTSPANKYYWAEEKQYLHQAKTCADLKKYLNALHEARWRAFVGLNASWFINTMASPWVKNIAAVIAVAGILTTQQSGWSLAPLAATVFGTGLAGMSFFSRKLATFLVSNEVRDIPVMENRSIRSGSSCK
jgi:ankyrin repeat protein